MFSPDDKFIYASCTDINYVITDDLKGNFLDTIKNVGGIRKFSDDCTYFWNVYGDKYTYPSLTKVTSIAKNLGRTNFNFQVSTINEHIDIVVIWDSGYYSPGQFEATVKNNLVIFKPSDIEIINTEIKYRYPNMNGSLLIHCNDADNNILCSHYEGWFCLLDNTATSITDSLFTTKNKATVI